jgi:hypothetical protein
MSFEGVRPEPEEIDDFQDAEGVDHKEYHEPSLLTTSRGVPERIPLYNYSPKGGYNDKRKYCQHQSRRIGRIEGDEIVH